MSIIIRDLEEDSSSLKRKKTSVLKKYSPTRSKSIEAANELSVILMALGRDNEALELLKSYSEESPFEAPRYERWEASCYAMLLQAHLEKLSGNETEFLRLTDKVGSDHFNPNNWFSESDFDEFIGSIDSGIDHIEGATKSEKLLVRAEGVLALLVALYLWSTKWSAISKRTPDLRQAIREELKRVAFYF